MSAPPPNQPRPKALATLDALIAQVEEAVEARRSAVQRLIATREDTRMISGQLRAAEQRLAQLRESRRVLLEGEAGDEASRKHAERGRRWRERRKASSEGTGEI